MKTHYLALWISLCSWSLAGAQNVVSVSFSKEAGLYQRAVRVALESDAPNARIYYTLDGSRPSNTATLYTKPILIQENTVIQAIAYAGARTSPLYTRTYFIDEVSRFAFVSLVIAPHILFDPTTGWMHAGPNADTTEKQLGANFWSRREEPAHIEIFEPNGSLIFSYRIGVRLFGGISRTFPQKSFAISTRTIYGDRRIKYPIFANKNIKTYKHLVLRNAGSDFPKAHFRDVFMTSLMDETDLETQAFRPALVFLNGSYEGIYYIREKVNKHFIGYNTGVEEDSIDLIEHRLSVKEGDAKHYQAMLRYMAANDLTQPQHYDYICKQMDVDNFITYQIAQIYFDNQDAGGNIKFWRPRTPDGRWRWILYDTDWGFGLQEADAYQHNSLAFHTATDGPAWPNPPWSTFILRNLLKNKTFRQTFADRFTDHLNTTFAPPRVLARLDSMERMLLPEIDRHLARWQLSRDNWQMHVQRMRTFAEKRPDYARQFLKQTFGLGNMVAVEIAPAKGGEVWVNGHVRMPANGIKGIYFDNQTVVLRAVPHYGYEFSHWEGLGKLAYKPEITLRLNNPINARPIFKKGSNHSTDNIHFNEIAANHKQAGDWLELHNAGNLPLSVEGWQLRDDAHEFTLPAARIPAKGYLVVCQDSSRFHSVFPEVLHVVSGLSFGINKRRELLLLYNPDGVLTDSVRYDLEAIDSVFSFALRHPSLDNSLPTNWDVEMNAGTPGQLNPRAAISAPQRWNWGWSGLLLLVAAASAVVWWWKSSKFYKK